MTDTSLSVALHNAISKKLAGALNFLLPVSIRADPAGSGYRKDFHNLRAFMYALLLRN
jgi:hypothetical protein